MTKRIRRAAVSLLLFALILPSCGGGERVPVEWEGRTLAGVEYRYKNGMAWGEDFEIVLTEERIVYSRRFSSLLRRYVEREDRALSAKRWSQIGEALLDIMPVLREVPASSGTAESPPGAMTDAPSGGELGLFLTWRLPDGSETRVRYYESGDRRFETVTALLREAAHPTGRKIPRYEAPVLSGMRVFYGSTWSEEDEGFRFECSPPEGKGDERQFEAAVAGNGKKLETSLVFSADDWEKIASMSENWLLENNPEGSVRDEYGLVLSYSDGTVRCFRPYFDLMESLRDFMIDLTKEKDPEFFSAAKEIADASDLYPRNPGDE